MDPKLRLTTAANITKFNREVCEGLAVTESKKLEKYIEDAFRCVFSNPLRGITFSHSRRCTPQEEYQVETALSYEKHTFELAPNDVYLMAYYFDLNGEPMARPHYMYLPFVREGGTLSLRGVKYHISPVLSDPGLSVESDSIFIWLTKTKLIFRRLTHTFFAGQSMINNTISCANIHHINEEAKSRRLPQADRPKAVATMMHYVFCKYGLTEAFRKYVDSPILIGGPELYEDPVVTDDDWEVFRSTGYRPYKVRSKDYAATEVHVAMPRDKINQTALNMLTALFYAIDHFPKILTAGYLDNTSIWQLALGHAIFKSSEVQGLFQSHIATHMESIEDYLDVISRLTLKLAGIEEEDIYSLFVHVDVTMTKRLLEADPSNMYGKRLTVINYLGFPYIKAINNLGYAIKSSKKVSLTEADVKQLLSGALKKELILSVAKENNWINVLSNPSDCFVFKTTSKMVPQSKAKREGKKSKGSSKLAESDILHTSIAEMGSAGYLPKSAPTGKHNVNPTIQLDPETGHAIRSEELRPITEAAQKDINRYQ